MIISLKDLIRESTQNNKQWLDSINVKNRIKNIIKNEKLPSEVIDFLWQKRELRRELVKYQVISEDKMKFIIDNYDNKKEISKPIYKAMIVSQNVSDDVLDYMMTIKYRNEMEFETWKYIPERMHQKYNVENLFYYLSDKDSYYIEAYIQTIVTISKKKIFLSFLLDFILKENLEALIIMSGGRFLESLCSSVFFDDEAIDKLSKILDHENFKKYSEYIISRGNCSQSSKALLLLLR